MNGNGKDQVEIDHQREIDELRGRQLALIRRMAPEDAIAILSAAPITHEEEQDVVANIIQRHTLLESLEQKGNK